MDVFARLIDELKNERGKGVTNQMMADRCGVSQQHINKLLNGKASLQKLNFGAVLNLFPRVRRLLEGDAQTISISNSPSSAAAINGTASAGGAEAAVAAIMASDMCAECEVKAYNAIMGRWGK